MLTLESISKKIEPILKAYGIKRAGIFGSFTNSNQHDSSDVDVLVDTSNRISLLEFVRIKLHLEDVLGRKVDLVEYDSIKPRLKNRILSEEVRIYG